MVKIEFYYKSADKDKTEAMREAIDIALFGTNVQCNFVKLFLLPLYKPLCY